jgi:hypothetical protein
MLANVLQALRDDLEIGAGYEDRYPLDDGAGDEVGIGATLDDLVPVCHSMSLGPGFGNPFWAGAGFGNPAPVRKSCPSEEILPQ